MLLLTSTSDALQVVTSAAVTVDAHASYVDRSGATITSGRRNVAITTATTTSLVQAPAASTERTIATMTLRNKHASSSVDVTIRHTDGTTVVEMVKVTLAAGWALHYDEGDGWELFDQFGRKLQATSATNTAIVGTFSTAALASDVTNNNASANTIADVTGLSFPVIAGQSYWFRFVVDYTAAATATGSRWSVTGPGATRLAYRSSYSLTTTSETVNSGLTAYDLPAASNATSASTGGNVAVVEGYITPSSDGNVTCRFASEVSSSAIVAKAGSLVQWARTL